MQFVTSAQKIMKSKCKIKIKETFISCILIAINFDPLFCWDSGSRIQLADGQIKIGRIEQSKIEISLHYDVVWKMQYLTIYEPEKDHFFDFKSSAHELKRVPVSVCASCVCIFVSISSSRTGRKNRDVYGSKVNAPVPKPMKPTKFPVASVLCCELCIHATQSKHFYTMSSSSTSWVLFSLDSPLPLLSNSSLFCLWVCVSSLLPTVHSRRLWQCIFFGNWKSCVRMFVYRRNRERN